MCVTYCAVNHCVVQTGVRLCLLLPELQHVEYLLRRGLPGRVLGQGNGHHRLHARPLALLNSPHQESLQDPQCGHLKRVSLLLCSIQ